MSDLPSNAAQLASSAYRLAESDADFLLGESLRGVRLQLEYEKVEAALRAYRVVSTIVVFGSSRARERGRARLARWYDEARAFGRLASLEGGAARARNGSAHNVVTTGGGPGLMEAANRGACEAGAPTIGFNITLPREQEPNPFTTPALTFRFHYFSIRKMHFAMRAKALVAFPGGFGTFDELFEVMTLVQTGKSPRVPIVLVDEDYWRSVLNLDRLDDYGVIDPRDRELLTFAEDAVGVWSALLDGGLTIPTD